MPLGRPATSIFLAWLSAALAITLTVLTAIYASRSECIAGYRLLGKSPSTALLMLRVLSELAGLMLTSTIYAAFDKLQWMLVSKSGLGHHLNLIEYLCLQPGLGVFTLLTMLFGFHVHKIMARLWSFLRLVSMALVPLLGILIMSNVDIEVFDKASTNATYGYGLGTFNASLASLWEPMTDLLFSTQFMHFLADPSRLQDITDPVARALCDAPHSAQENCNVQYYMAGGIENWVPWLLASGHQDADAFLATNQNGYMLEYRDGRVDWQFNPSTECSIYGRSIAALALCMRNNATNIINSRLHICPDEVAAAGDCLTDSSWTAAGGFPTSLKTTFRHADVAYSRLNGTILSLKFSKAPSSPAPIAASDLLHAFDVVFSSNNSQSPFAIALTPIGLANNTPSLPLYAWWYFKGLADLSAADNGARRRGISALQSLMALPLYHCQNKDFAELRKLGYDNSTWVAQTIIAQFPQEDNATKTPIYPATLRYKVAVGRGSLIGYVVISGLTLVACVVALVVGTRESEKVEETSAIPALDFVMKCRVVRGTGLRNEPEVVDLQDFHRLGKNSRSGRLDDMAAMTVQLYEEQERMENGTVGRDKGFDDAES